MSLTAIIARAGVSLLRFMRKPVILGVASVSRLWLDNFADVKILNVGALHDAIMSRGRDIPLLSVSNHISTVDDPVMWGGLLTNRMISELIDRNQMRHVLAAQDIVFTNPIFRWFFSTGQAIPVVRGDGIFQAGMQQCLDVMNLGRWLHFFPEGRVIQKNNFIGRLKWGVGRLVMESERAPLIIPIILRGFDIMKPLDRLPRLFKPVQIVVGEPVDSRFFLQSTRHVDNQGERRSQITALVQDLLNKTLETVL